MIIIRLAGGLGNQIFQLGAGLLLAQSSGNRILFFDDSALNKYDSKRENELLNFFDFSKLEIEIVFKKSFISSLRLPKLLPFNIQKYPFVSDKNFQTVLHAPNNSFAILDGYFQKCLTQEDFDEEVKLLKNIFTVNMVVKKDGCIIHIRGGDFVKLGWNSATPKEYYVRAIETMKVNYNQNNFYIVTDDRDYSKTILNELDLNYEFIGSNTYEDFKLIGSFNFRILSSSTFALWASALGNNKNNIVIAPKNWIPGYERKILLPNETRIEG